MSDRLPSSTWKNPTAWAFRRAAEDAAGAAAHGILRGASVAGRALGLPNAAENLAYFLDGTGSIRHIPREQARQRSIVQSGEHVNRRRFEKAFLLDRLRNPDRNQRDARYEYRSHLLNMRDGETIRVPPGPKEKNEPRDVYDHVRTPGQLLRAGDLDEALATGHSQFSSEAKDGFVAKREENRIIVEGVVTHTWVDPYDFDGGYGSDLPETARDHGTAREYTNSTAYRQKLRAEFIIKHGELEPRSYEWTDMD